MPDKSKNTKADQTAEEKLINKGKVSVMPEQFRHQQLAEDKEGGNRKLLFVFAIAVVVLIGGGAAVYLLFFQEEDQQLAVINQPAESEAPAEEDVSQPKPEEEAPSPEPEAVNENVNVPAIPPIFADVPGSSRDSDQDGLTDVEEAMYGTEISDTDSDGDGHSDQLELINLYNPAASAPADLADSGLINIYENDNYNYEIYHPASFVVRPLDDKRSQVMFTAATSEFVEVVVYENPDNLSVVNWYLENTQGVTRSDLQAIATKEGYRGVKTRDGLTVYLVKPVSQAITPQGETAYIYSISYNPGTRNELSFESTFEMMIASFKLIESGVAEFDSNNNQQAD